MSPRAEWAWTVAAALASLGTTLALLSVLPRRVFWVAALPGGIVAAACFFMWWRQRRSN